LREEKEISAKGWLLDVMNCIERLGHKEFSLDEVYTYVDVLSKKHPENKHIKDKILLPTCVNNMAITMSPLLAKIILRFNPFRSILVVCKGYSEDYGNFTELVWEDDKDLDFYDKETYPQFQLWIH